MQVARTRYKDHAWQRLQSFKFSTATSTLHIRQLSTFLLRMDERVEKRLQGRFQHANKSIEAKKQQMDTHLGKQLPNRPQPQSSASMNKNKQVPHRARRDDLFESRRQHGHTQRRAKPVEDIIAELELRDERQKHQITMLHGKVNEKKEEVGQLKAKSTKDDKEIRDLRGQLAVRNHNSISEVVDVQAAADAHAATQDALIRFGTNAVKEQRLRAETAESEVLRQTTMISEQLEPSISELQNLVAHYEAVMSASADDYTRTCLEAQALSSVRMVKGYQNDIGRLRGTIDTLRSEIAARDKALREYEQKEFGSSREVQEAKRELAAEKKRAETLEGICVEQESLIERLNNENGKLVAMTG